MRSVAEYLAIPDDYARSLGGLRWSEGGDAVEFSARDPEVGLTFALGAEIAPFLEGLAPGDDLPHFAHVLHLLHLLGLGLRGDGADPGRPPAPEVRDLARAFRAGNRPLRNAGALCRSLCRGIPPAADPPPLDRVVLHLTGWSATPWAARAARAPAPPLPPAEFEARFVGALRGLTPEALRHWLRHGRGPVGSEAGEAAARVVPRSLGEALAALEARPRLAGASALVARLDGALTLPPRRLSDPALPLGGYSDVATRGQPEQILPAQFALDPDEFLRRFAARELLYFHREEPQAPAARELVVVVDQGVRTWGDVRLVLAAAAVALGRQADRRGQPLRFAATSRPGPALDPRAADPEALGALLDASDLSAGPAEALGRALDHAAGDPAPRDLVVLTHPRNLDDPSLTAAARAAPAGTRLFAVAADASGEVTLSELRRGVPVALGRCRVEVRPAEPERPEPAAGPDDWRGDVEPVGFPFRVGPTGPVDDRHFDFDHAGEWLLVADQRGLLRAYRTDGSAWQMIPRATLGGAAVTEVEALVGVAGGFVVVGRAGGRRAAAHHDFRRRTVKAHDLVPFPDHAFEWTYDRGAHAVVATMAFAPVGVVDLVPDVTNAVILSGQTGGPATRAGAAFLRAGRDPDVVLTVHERGAVPAFHGRLVHLDPETGKLGVRTPSGHWEEATYPSDGVFEDITFESDGLPLLRGSTLVRARSRGDALALLATSFDRRRWLHTFARPSGWRASCTFTPAADARDFALSRDGRLVAFRAGVPPLVVHETFRVAPVAVAVGRGRVHQALDLRLGRGFLALKSGRHSRLVRWDLGPLEVSWWIGGVEDLLAQKFRLRPPADPSRVPATHRPPRYEAEPTRFYAAAVLGGRTAAVDRLGQVAVFAGPAPGRLVAMFFAFRDQFAAWLPDGTRLGPVHLIGGPPTPRAAERIGAALREAGESAPWNLG